MLLQMDYIEKDGCAYIVRCYGEGSRAELPSAVNGLPVIGLYDHCFAPEKSGRLKGKVIRRWNPALTSYPGNESCHELMPDKVKHPGRTDQAELGEEYAMCGDRIEELILPSGLRIIDDYALYGCVSLVKLTIPETLERLGRGVMTATDRLKELVFLTREGEVHPACMREVLSEVTQEVLVRCISSGEECIRLVYPEYYEESIENTPARLIGMHFEGTGFRYRQCFNKSSIDMKRYDDLFQIAIFQEYAPTVRRLALSRLMVPYELGDSAKESYIQYLREGAAELAKSATDEEAEQLKESGYFTEEVLSSWLDVIDTSDRPYLAARLLEWKRKMTVKKSVKNRYVF